MVMCLQVQRVEEQHDVFAFVLGKTNVFKLSIYDSGAAESGSRFLELRHWHDCCLISVIRNRRNCTNIVEFVAHLLLQNLSLVY